MNDLISRQAAIDAICNDWCGCKNSQCRHPFKPEEDEYYWCDGCYSIECIKNLPSAPERQTGKWIEHTYKANYLDWHERTCSVCKLVFGYFAHWNYCPHCGAKMEGEKNDD